MSVETLDPFATEAEAAPPARKQRQEIITGGRYRLPNRDGSHHKGGWQRVSNRVSAFADQFGLRLWEIEQVVLAVKTDPRLIAEIDLPFLTNLPKDERREWIAFFLEKCKAISKGNEGSLFGNTRHAQVEADHESLPIPADDAYARRHLHLYRSALVRNALRAVPGMQERRVLIERMEIIGTLDNILEDLVSDCLRIGDLKTQKRFWTWLLVAAQLAAYANGDAMWESANDPENPRAGRWVDMPKVDKEIGLILWMPREPVNPEEPWEPHVDVYEVDLVAGLKTLELCALVVADRQAAKQAHNPRAWLRKAPVATETEKYAARFAAVSTVAEGRALVAEARAKGVWSPILEDEAIAAKKRISRGLAR
jgi:hypothetical protein